MEGVRIDEEAILKIVGGKPFKSAILLPSSKGEIVEIFNYAINLIVIPMLLTLIINNLISVHVHKNGDFSISEIMWLGIDVLLIANSVDIVIQHFVR